MNSTDKDTSMWSIGYRIRGSVYNVSFIVLVTILYFVPRSLRLLVTNRDYCMVGDFYARVVKDC